jgi:L-alanine-DL-glutamate epimerase-like enolase superfamily enzyme
VALAGLPAALGGLPVRVEGCALEPLELETPGFTRLTTVVALHGGGCTGRGEDVSYVPALQLEHRARAPFALTGEDTLAGWCAALDGVALLDDATAAAEPSARDYRRWAYESALLDLALRQRGATLGDVLGRRPGPVRFCVSSRLGPEAWLPVAPELEFKLDAGADWDADAVARLAALGRVRVVDIKAHYGDAWGLAADDAQRLLEVVVNGMPEAIVEDPPVDDAALAVLAGRMDRVAFDAPVHRVADLERLPATGWMNIKPSRFGTLAELLAAIGWCEERSVRLYGGGQFELGPGRRQIQELAALWYPDGPNDVAPGAYNAATATAGLPTSPLAGLGAEPGFGA